MSIIDTSHLLEKAERYSAWASYTKGILLKNNCEGAILENQSEITAETIKEGLIQACFDAKGLSVSILVKELRDEKNRQKAEMTKAIGIIHGLVAECHYSLIDNKNAAEIWKILKDRFQDIAPMSISDIILKVSSKKMTDFETTSLYCAEYESALNKIKGMLDDKAKVDVHTVEFMLQGMMLGNTTDVYSPLIAQLRRDWTHETTNLSEAMKTIVAYSVNMKNTKALHISTPDSRGRAPFGTCAFSECVERKNTRHWPDNCWQKFPQLKRHRSSLESGRAKKQKTTSSETKADLPHTSPNIPTVSS